MVEAVDSVLFRSLPGVCAYELSCTVWSPFGLCIHSKGECEAKRIREGLGRSMCLRNSSSVGRLIENTSVIWNNVTYSSRNWMSAKLIRILKLSVVCGPGINLNYVPRSKTIRISHFINFKSMKIIKLLPVFFFFPPALFCLHLHWGIHSFVCRPPKCL